MDFEKGTVCEVIVDENGMHHIKMPNGDLIPRIIWTRVYNGLPNEPSTIIVKLFVNLKPTENGS